MMNAYDKVYLEKARTALGRMLDLQYMTWGMALRSSMNCSWRLAPQTASAPETTHCSSENPALSWPIMYWSNPASRLYE